MRISIRRDNSGQALLLVVVTVSVLLTMTAALYLVTGMSRKNIIGEQQLLRALYAADAGIEKATAKIVTEAPARPAWYTGLSGGKTGILSGVLPGNATFAVRAGKGGTIPVGTLLTLESTGQCLDGQGKMAAQKTVLANAPVFTAGDYFHGLSILPAQSKLFNYTDNLPVLVNGDLVLNGSLGNLAPLQVNGRSYTNDNYAYIPPCPKLDSRYYEDRAEANGEFFYTDATFASLPDRAVPYDGFYYVDGDLDISGAFSGSAVFFAAGDITVAANLIPQPDADGVPHPEAGSLTLIALGDIKLVSCTAYANLMAKGIKVWGDAVVYGGICVTDSEFKPGGPGSGSLVVYAAGARSPRPEAVPLAIKITGWRELYAVL